ncbi:probetacellulin-like [Thalassophryne amazonica]|uniref:probetacellulin-like n=1 Tax=Thalassophryne amazonica TaxID=390379 RepID=UPI001471DFB2|nr:probetacellulin-like [Thalassophryne amazonica]
MLAIYNVDKLQSQHFFSTKKNTPTPQCLHRSNNKQFGVILKHHYESLSTSALTDWELETHTGNTTTKPFQMMAGHGNPCSEQEATFCMHGGTCYKIPSMNTLSCVCHENYKGSRCEQFQLFSSSTEAGQAGLIAAVAIIALLILVVLAVVIYYLRKVLKAKQNQRDTQHHYWKVPPRV